MRLLKYAVVKFIILVGSMFFFSLYLRKQMTLVMKGSIVMEKSRMKIQIICATQVQLTANYLLNQKEDVVYVVMWH